MEWKSTLKIVESTLKRVIQTTILWNGFDYFEWISTPKRSDPSMTPERVDFHSTALREYCNYFRSEIVITLSLISPLLYPLYNQQSFSGLPHGVTVNYISHHYYAMEKLPSSSNLLLFQPSQWLMKGSGNKNTFIPVAQKKRNRIFPQLCRCNNWYQGRTQEFFRGGGKICNIVGKTQARARSARAGGGSGRGVSSLPDEGAFAFLRLKLNDLVHTLGGFPWGNCQ